MGVLVCLCVPIKLSTLKHVGTMQWLCCFSLHGARRYVI